MLQKVFNKQARISCRDGHTTLWVYLVTWWHTFYCRCNWKCVHGKHSHSCFIVFILLELIIVITYIHEGPCCSSCIHQLLTSEFQVQFCGHSW